jgi:hypothetical protein
LSHIHILPGCSIDTIGERRVSWLKSSLNAKERGSPAQTLKLRGGLQPNKWDRSRGVMGVDMSRSSRPKTSYHEPEHRIADPARRPDGSGKSVKAISKPMWQVHAELQAKAKKMRQEQQESEEVAGEEELDNAVKKVAGDAYEQSSNSEESCKNEQERLQDQIKKAEKAALAFSGDVEASVVFGKREGKSIYASKIDFIQRTLYVLIFTTWFWRWQFHQIMQ